MTQPIENKVILFCTGVSRTFFTANGRLFVICGFSACQQAGADGGAESIRELALEILSDTHGRIGQSPEKAQIFLFILVMAFSRIVETHTTSNAYG